jgi:hypothetical protein
MTQDLKRPADIPLQESGLDAQGNEWEYGITGMWFFELKPVDPNA